MDKRKIALLSIAGMITLGAGIAGSTFALFSGSASNTGNSFTAGTLTMDVRRDNGDPVPGPMFYPDSLDPLAYHPYDQVDTAPSGESIGGWAPGDVVVRDMYLINTGTLTAKLTGIRAKVRGAYTQTTTDSGRTASNTINGETSTSNKAAYDEFVSKMNIKIVNGAVVLYNGSLQGLVSNSGWVAPNSVAVVAADPLAALNLQFTASLSKDAGNVIQGKNFIFDFEFMTEQKKNN